MHAVRGGAALEGTDTPSTFPEAGNSIDWWLGANPEDFGLRPVGQAHIGIRGVVDPTFALSEISALVWEPSKKAGRILAMRSSGRQGLCGVRQAEPEPG